MKHWYALALTLSCLTCQPHQSIRGLIRTLLNRQSNITLSYAEQTTTQSTLLQALKTTNHTDFTHEPIQLFLATQALTRHSRYHHLVAYERDLLTSFAIFKDTPGYLETLHRILSHADQREMVIGHGFEIAHALKLHMDPCTPERIVSFNIHLSDGQLTRRLDLETTDRFIECKNCRFAQRYRSLIKQQLSDQAALIKKWNALSQEDRPLELHSKQPVPQSIQTWCHQHNIRVEIAKKP